MATSVHDLMMFSDDQGDSSFRVFWGLPPTQQQAAFHQLRAAGGPSSVFPSIPRLGRCSLHSLAP